MMGVPNVIVTVVNNIHFIVAMRSDSNRNNFQRLFNFVPISVDGERVITSKGNGVGGNTHLIVAGIERDQCVQPRTGNSVFSGLLLS